jgi:hypothetical protein
MAKINLPRNEGESEADYRRRYHRAWEDQDRRAKGIQPKVKPSGPCSVEGCARDAEVKGMCGNHYRAERLRKMKAQGLEGRGKRQSHPLYSIWFERKSRGSLCDEWANDFWVFVEAVGDRPSPTHLLRRFTTKRPYTPDNWHWLPALRRAADEPKEAFNSRKWTSRRENFPDYEGRRWLMRKYGLTPQDYIAMFEAQGGVCATCGKPETSVHHTTRAPKALSVDHCHATGRVRGLLCWHCNSVLGKVDDDPNVLRAMALYLEQPTALGLPPRPG